MNSTNDGAVLGASALATGIFAGLNLDNILLLLIPILILAGLLLFIFLRRRRKEQSKK